MILALILWLPASVLLGILIGQFISVSADINRAADHLDSRSADYASRNSSDRSCLKASGVSFQHAQSNSHGSQQHHG